MTQYDRTISFNGALIQYGPMNDRIYLMKLKQADPAIVIAELDVLAMQHKLGKIFAKIPLHTEAIFQASGYRREGCVPKFYDGKEDAVFLGKYFDTTRMNPENAAELEQTLAITKQKSDSPHSPCGLSDGFSFRHCREEDAETISAVYRQVFPTYPFPIHDPAYIQKTMRDNILYFSIRHADKIVSLSSAEMDKQNRNVEMTDFATLPAFRGHSFAQFLLEKMEVDMRKLGIKTAYTIARAVSPGMNITFARMRYQYGGTLINNTNISGNIESMNIWHKTLIET